MKEIEEFKQNNNNAYVKYSTKELIAGLHTKIDLINTKLTEGEKKFATIETNIFWLKSAVTGLFVALGGFLVWSFKTIVSWFE